MHTTNREHNSWWDLPHSGGCKFLLLPWYLAIISIHFQEAYFTQLILHPEMAQVFKNLFICMSNVARYWHLKSDNSAVCSKKDNDKGKIKALHYWPFVMGIHWLLVASSRQQWVIQKAYPFHDVIMLPCRWGCAWWCCFLCGGRGRCWWFVVWDLWDEASSSHHGSHMETSRSTPWRKIKLDVFNKNMQQLHNDDHR